MSYAYPDLEKDTVRQKLPCFGMFPAFLEKIFTTESSGALMQANLESDYVRKPYTLKEGKTEDKHDPELSKRQI